MVKVEILKKMLRTSWAYSLRQEDLVAYLMEFGFDTTRKVEELRKRWGKFLGAEREADIIKRLLTLQAKHENLLSISSPSTNIGNTNKPTMGPSESFTKIVTSSPVKLEVPTHAPIPPTENSRSVSTDPKVHRLPLSPVKMEVPKATQQLAPSPPNAGYQISVIDQVRKWGVKFDKGQVPLGFIERIEDLATMYQVE